MEKAAFALKHYFFEKAELNLANLQVSESLNLKFDPKGCYIQKEGTFHLSFSFVATKESNDEKVVFVLCRSIFQFQTPIEFENIPEYFYSNVIAILFPYIRAFVSTLTIQANVKPILLPTMNLSSLSAQLKKNTSAER